MVAVRVRPFTADESTHLMSDELSLDSSSSLRVPKLGDSNLSLKSENPDAALQTKTKRQEEYLRSNATRPDGIRKIVDCVDDKMLIFDPLDTNPLHKMSENVLNSMYSRRQLSRRRQRRRGTNGNGEIKFVFDKLFDQDASQETVYQSTTSGLLDSVLDGFNGTVFAYGATGCGKTYTVSGTPEQPGIIFRVMQELFERMEDLKDTKRFELSLSYLEIYNETIRDLLKPETVPKRLIIREDGANKISVSNLSYHNPQTVQEVIDLVIKGNINRTTSPTEANEVSSRSHAVLQIHIMQTNRTADLTSEHTFATLSIIDLAGSERAAATKNRGERLYEGANINRSLLALGNCINALCLTDGGTNRSCHIPYRDSKLTRLLKFSLGGNCKTVMIVCISPSSSHYDETLNTLKYANRAKEIKTKIIRNQQSLNRHVGSYLKMITEQKREIEELRERETKMIELQLRKYKISRERIQMAQDDCIQNIIKSYSTLPKYKMAKNMKSLMLCKRRFLQMVKLEIENCISLIQNWTDHYMVFETCGQLNNQIMNKIRELEREFDSKDELELVIDHVRVTDLVRLREMENWDDSTDLIIFESRLDYISESIRNEILVNASIMTEKLFQNEILMQRCKFLSTCLANEQNLANVIQDLIKLDEEFEEFGKLLINEDYGVREEKLEYRATKNEMTAATATSSAPLKKVRWLPDTSDVDINMSVTAETDADAWDQPEPLLQDETMSMQDTPAPTPASSRKPRSLRTSLLSHRLVTDT